MGVSTGISQPHIVASIGQYETQSTLRARENPIRRGGDQTVLQEDWDSSLSGRVHSAMRNTMQSQQVAVTGGNRVCFQWVFIECDDLFLVI